MSFIDTKNDFVKKSLEIKKHEIKPTTYSSNANIFQINTWNTPTHSDQVIQFDTDGLKDFLNILKHEFPDLNPESKTTEIKKVVVPLLDKNNEPQYGLNWGQRINREPNQAYIQLPIEVYRSDFFPKKPERFFVHTDDGLDLKLTRAQKTDEGTALQTPEDNSLFGKYLRTRMGIPLGDEITKEAILRYGCKEITFFKVGKQFFMDFSGNSKINIDSEHFESVTSVPFSISKFTNNNTLFTRYIRSLLAKPFVILTGNSGTGKTRIATRFAKYLERKNESGLTNHLLIPVGADWTDNTKILGYYNPLANNGAGEYVKSEILEFIETASDNPDIPFFLILDEMNLSHVERYFSDFLSAMESGEPIPLYKKQEDDVSHIPEEITLPKNLFITGTVNIDETTYMFSPKVLDRANVIEFKPEMEDVLDNLLKSSNGDDDKTAEPGVAEGFMKLANEVCSGTIPEEVQTVLKGIKPILESFYKELEKCGFEFAYRTVKEIRLYAIAAFKTAEGEKPTPTDIADIQILQKILPKIHGNKKQIGSLLDELEKLCADYKLEESGKKIRQMKDKLNRFQYASFI